MPGFPLSYPCSLLPFWGNFRLVDFMLACFSPTKDLEVAICIDESFRGLAPAISGRWKKPFARVRVAEEGVDGLIRTLAGAPEDRVVVASLSSVCVFDPGVLNELANREGEELVKLAVGRTPVEMYCTRRERLLALLGNKAARPAGGIGFRRLLFEEVLLHSIDLIAEMPGEILFQNDLMEYFHSHLWLAANGESDRFHRIVSRLPELAAVLGESRIAEKGCVRDSFLAAGVEIEGTVEGSVIFPNVIVRKNARVSRSVVLSGNCIGAGAEIQNALILPRVSEAPRPAINIGDNCSIGTKGSSQRNVDFPDQIRDGLAVVGVDAEIPNGFRADAASCIGPGVPIMLLKKMKSLRRGASVFGGSA